MQLQSIIKKYGLLFLLLFGPALIYFLMRSGSRIYRTLPFLGPHEVPANAKDDHTAGDTIYHSIPHFSLTAHNGNIFTQDDLNGRIAVVDFFFVSCPSVCPKLTKNLSRIQKEFADLNDFIIVSHTVDPKRDTAEALAAYAKKYKAIDGQWFFLTGTKEEIYSIGIKGYLISASEDALAPGGFMHSQLFVLLDRERHIRGFYDGTDDGQVEKLINDIKILYTEYALKESEKKSLEYRK